MGDRKDKELGKGTLKKKDEDVVGVTLPVGDGLRRSRRVRKLPPSQSEGGGGSSASAGERKRKRGRQQQEAEDPMEEEEVTHDGDDVKVKKSVKVRPGAAKASSVSGGVGMEDGEVETGKRSLRRPRPLLVEKGHQSSEVGGGAIVKGGESSSSSVMSSGAAGRSEDGSSPQQSAEEEEAHPCLLIENVLEVIFKHIVDRPRYEFRKNVAEDIQSIRLVCTTWRDEGTRAYRRYGPAATFSEYEQASQNSGRKSLAAFTDMMKSSQMMPVQQFKFYGSVFRQKNLKLFRDFLLLCGPEVVSLELSIDSSDAERIMANLKDLPDLNLLKLRALTLCMGEQGHHDSDVKIKASQVRETVNLVKFFLTAAKELRELDLSYHPYCCFDYREGQAIIMDKLGPIIATGIPKTVKELKLYMRITESTFNELAKVGLQLERFEFGLPSGIERRTLYEFLQSQAATLKQFRFRNGCHQEDIVIEFPRLDELIKLELSTAGVKVAAHSEFAATFPKLHSLDIAGMSSDVALQALLASVKTPSQSLKICHLPSWRYKSISLAPFIKDVARSFPCLVELHISIDHETQEALLEVFKYFDQIEVLTIFISELNLIRQMGWADPAFSGISEHDCFKLSRLQDFGNVNLNEFQRQPSLLNLTKLRKLSIHINIDSEKITDFMAHFVFLEMAELRELRLSNMRFSPRYIDLLRNKLVIKDYYTNNRI